MGGGGVLMAGNPARVQDLHELSRIWTRRKLRVMENPGWETYGRSSTMTFDAMGIHHTGSGSDLDRLLWAGRPKEGIPGPLCNLALHARSALPGFIGEVVLMASGRANHFGVATWSSSRALGVEATGPPFTNYPAYVQLAAGFCEWKGADPAKVLRSDTAIDVYLLAAHKEVAQPYGRKPDPSGTGWHEGGRTIAGVRLIDVFRADVRAALTTSEEDDMTDEQARQLQAIYDAMIVPGTKTGEDTMDVLFARIRNVEGTVGRLAAAQGVSFTPVDSSQIMAEND